MITISDKSRSAVLALTELARNQSGCPVPILDVSEARGIPLHVLEQLFAALRRAGILQSQRGVKGGYSFRRPPAEVSVLEVVETVDGRLTGWEREGPVAGAESVWVEVREHVAGLLGAVTLADIAEREVRELGAPMFHI